MSLVDISFLRCSDFSLLFALTFCFRCIIFIVPHSPFANMLLNFSRNARRKHLETLHDRSKADPNALDPENPKTATAYVVADKTQTDVKRLKYLENKAKPALTEGLFWHQEFRAAAASPGFVFKKGDTFKTARGNFQDALQKASESDPALLQLWYILIFCLPLNYIDLSFQYSKYNSRFDRRLDLRRPTTRNYRGHLKQSLEDTAACYRE